MQQPHFDVVGDLGQFVRPPLVLLVLALLRLQELQHDPAFLVEAPFQELHLEPLVPVVVPHMVLHQQHHTNEAGEHGLGGVVLGAHCQVVLDHCLGLEVIGRLMGDREEVEGVLGLSLQSDMEFLVHPF